MSTNSKGTPLMLDLSLPPRQTSATLDARGRVVLGGGGSVTRSVTILYNIFSIFSALSKLPTLQWKVSDIQCRAGHCP